jgi:general stress protein YciG
MNTEFKNEADVALGKRGGKARGKNLSPKRRSEIARMGGLARAKSVPPKIHILKVPCTFPGCKITVGHEHV